MLYVSTYKSNENIMDRNIEGFSNTSQVLVEPFECLDDFV
jgi:hypothetical protein